MRSRPRSENRIRSRAKLWPNASKSIIEELYDRAEGFGETPGGLRSALRVPIGPEGARGGALTWMSKRKLAANDLVLAEELARRISIAIEQRKLRAEARAAAKERDELISVAGHELRTPLASLELHVSALLRAARSGTLSTLSRQRVVEKLERAHAQIDRLTGALEQVLSVRRTRDDDLLLTPCEADWSGIVREIVARARPDAERTGCVLSLDARRPVIGRWDPELIERAVSNVLGFILGPGEARGTVEIVVRRAARGARCSMHYNGAGLSAREQIALLGPPSRDGTRLGLWIARQIIEAHRGRLAVRSAPGAGITFVVELPATEAP